MQDDAKDLGDPRKVGFLPVGESEHAWGANFPSNKIDGVFPIAVNDDGEVSKKKKKKLLTDALGTSVWKVEIDVLGKAMPDQLRRHEQ